MMLLVLTACVGWTAAGRAQPLGASTAAQRVLDHRGFTADVGDLVGLPQGAAIMAALRRQIDICVEAGLPPATLAFIRSVPVRIKVIRKGEPGFNSGSGFYDGKRVTLQADVYPSENPVLLHEFLHAYHHQKLPGGKNNPDVLTFYQRAQTTPGMYPAGSYMQSNVGEYFAMTASVFLHGRAARPPSTRANLRANQPLYFAWLEKEFGPH